MKTSVTKICLCFLLMTFLISGFAATEDINDTIFQEEPGLPLEFQMPGIVEGTGTFFEVNDSNYINIIFESTEPVQLRLESIPEMIVMEIEAVNDVNSTQITLGGFEPSTTYYKYEDNYHNDANFTTDPNGSYTYIQDITKQHIVFIQPRPSTIFLSSSGWSDPTVGTWDADTQTGTLMTDLYETIQIDSDGITLDGNGKTITGTNTGNGIYFYYKTGVTIKNVNIQGFNYGIYLIKSNGNTIAGCTSSSNYLGISLVDCDSSTLTNNTSSNNQNLGIWLRSCIGTTLTNNTSSMNGWSGITLSFSGNSTLTNNTVSNNDHTGIRISASHGNTLTQNNASDNTSYGIWMEYGSNSTLTNNTVLGSRTGIELEKSHYITLRDNNISGAQYCNFCVLGSLDHHFEHDIDTTNTVDGKPIYYVRDVAGEVYDSSIDAGIFYAINCDNITVKELTLTGNLHGVFFWKTSNSSIENVTCSDNQQNGIYVAYSNNNTLTNNTVSNNSDGIRLENSPGNTLTQNNASDNTSCGIRLENSPGNTLTQNNASDNTSGGIWMEYCSNSTLIGNTASNNNFGILLLWTDCSTLTDNTTSYNYASVSSFGIGLAEASGNTLRNNNSTSNGNGISLYMASNNNQVYNNNFIDNGIQVYVHDSGGSGNVFNQTAPIGGNYWSDWTGPDDDYDGFVDYPYLIYDTYGNLMAQDDLPWVRQDGWVAPRLIQALVVKVLTLNLQQGIENELDAKLNSALGALDDINTNNDVAAINNLNAFISAVQAQNDKKITIEDADALIAAAQEIILVLSNP